MVLVTGYVPHPKTGTMTASRDTVKMEARIPRTSGLPFPHVPPLRDPHPGLICEALVKFLIMVTCVNSG